MEWRRLVIAQIPVKNSGPLPFSRDAGANCAISRSGERFKHEQQPTNQRTLKQHTPQFPPARQKKVIGLDFSFDIYEKIRRLDLMNKELPRPTESELQILAVLWQKSPATVREVYSRLGWKTGYTTVLKFMQIMTDKGLLMREKQGKTHFYRPTAPAERMQKTLVGDLLHRAFGGSLKKLMVAALSQEHTSAADLEEIRRLIQEQEKLKNLE
jgi:predicted transcriptional regulator